MWNDLSWLWQECFKGAWTSYSYGSLPIGAVIVDGQGRIIARGRNRFHEQSAECNMLAGHRLAHAEMNALLQIPWDSVDLSACALYTTTEPCPYCVGAIRMVRLGEVHYASHEGATSGAALFEANAYMRCGHIKVVGPESTDLEIILVAMFIEWALRRSLVEESVRMVYEYSAARVPRGTLLGQQLFSSQQLSRWSQEGRTASFVYEHLMKAVAQMPSSL